ncbi:hypothetical protein [Paenibacillus senegalensis]|uniref:hypothetical protein n=1 Tax=Paenibacillus senegalensis TaxID=1465766 RepID=UPI000287E50D|nr:hypothetical protein [Paenibacillus senegalensis]
MHDPNFKQEWHGFKKLWQRVQSTDRYDLLGEVHRRLDRYHLLAKQLEKLMETSVGLAEEWNKNKKKKPED